ncbi:hypothetical protein CBR_g24286 [Chara braunii]|uniref:Mitochondrial import inner membrane translocase subunit TIM50 n=1 Tax=Chara braunii TaxID=69332 RepID=A0A388JM99_CHABU|nr:hypothetical protein CBR_g24286 [Chara braunii]|eukprot:GBG58934.1 hypothetical protein CBR_g24286 [Chara braunii]
MASVPPLLGDIWTDIEGRVTSWNGAAMERKSDMAGKELVGTSAVVGSAQSFAVGAGLTKAGAEERVGASKRPSTSTGGTGETDWLKSTGWEGGKLHRSDNERNEFCCRKEPSDVPDTPPDSEECPITQFTGNGAGSSKQVAMRAVEGFQGWRLGSRTPGNLSSCIAAVMKPKRGSLPELARTIRQSGCAAIGEHHAPQLWQTILCCLRPGSTRKQSCRGLRTGNTSESDPFSREEQIVPAVAAPLHPPYVPRLSRDSKICHDQPLRNITTGMPMSIPSSPSQGLMPPMRPEDVGKKTLVLDLDETLVHSSFKPIPNADYIIPVEINKRMTDVYVLKRPWVDHFMKKMGQRFEVSTLCISLAFTQLLMYFQGKTDDAYGTVFCTRGQQGEEQNGENGAESDDCKEEVCL